MSMKKVSSPGKMSRNSSMDEPWKLPSARERPPHEKYQTIKQRRELTIFSPL